MTQPVPIRRNHSPPPPHDLEAEESVLGAALLSQTAYDEAIDTGLTADDFYKPAHAHVWHAITHLVDAGTRPDPITVTARLRDQALLDQVGGQGTIISYQAATPALGNAAAYADLVIGHARLRRLMGAAAEILTRTGEPVEDVARTLSWAENLIQTAADHTAAARPVTAHQMMVGWLESLIEPKPQGIPTPWNRFNEITGGLRPGLTVIFARPGTGKAQPVSTPTLTPTGWRPMGELTPGDEVIGSDGKPTTIVAVHPQGVRPVFTVVLSDGTSTTTCAEHLWRTQSHGQRAWGHQRTRFFLPANGGHWRVASTTSIRADIAAGKARAHHLPVAGPIEHSPRPLPIDPYLFGLLLGDGSFRGNRVLFTSDDPELHEAVAAALPPLLRARPYTRMSVILTKKPVPGAPPQNPLMEALRGLGLMEKSSTEKSIPEMYLHASVEQRLAVLQGVLDTDGWNEKRSVRFCSASRQLALDVAELGRSLGGRCSIPRYKHNDCAGAWNVTLRLPVEVQPYRLRRKLDQWQATRALFKYPPDRKIVAVEPAGEAECVCITVDAPDHLYVTEHHIVTHNSAVGLNLAEWAAVHHHPTLLCSLEMDANEIQDRLVALRTGLNHTHIRDRSLGDRDLTRVSEAAAAIAPMPLHVLDDADLTVARIASAARRIPRLRLLLVDYAQLITPPPGRYDNREQQVSAISKALVRLRKQLRIPVVALAQSKRPDADTRRNKRPTVNDIRESGSLENDADLVVSLYRDEMHDPKTKDRNLMELHVHKQRNGPSNKTVKVAWNGATFRVADLTHQPDEEI